MVQRRERDIESAAVRDARSKGWVAIKVGFDGWPDRLFVKDNHPEDCGYMHFAPSPQHPFGLCVSYKCLKIKAARHVWVEYKRPGQKLTALQERKHAHLREQGAEVYVCHSTEETREVLGE